ncbi:MAG: Rrf2 family transcriptional regulator [Lachnospiraceae bacterium]|nr:Rrf2 family transcriptional regulator [Lachnospiraceae bacterium]
MKISTKGKYGLRAMIDLAQYSEQEAVSISSIAQRQKISESYLEQLVAKLKKAGLVVSTRGAAGGYRLARSASEISVGDVLRALEGDVRAVICTAQTEEGCEGEELCVTKYVWQRINESIEKTVDEMMLDQLVAESRKAQEKAKNHDVDYSRNSCSG